MTDVAAFKVHLKEFSILLVPFCSKFSVTFRLYYIYALSLRNLATRIYRNCCDYHVLAIWSITQFFNYSLF